MEKRVGKYLIALAGNPNAGKTTLFNRLTGGAEYVGNWPGVTVTKKEGRLLQERCVVVEDLPGIYSLSPYTAEEIVSRKYLVEEKPDIIVNIVDGTNLERHLYLTTQLLEVGLPVVVAVNRYDEIKYRGDKLNVDSLSKILGCKVVPISALTGEGVDKLVSAIQDTVKNKDSKPLPHVFSGSVEHALAHIEESIQDKVEERYIRWYAVKIFEKDKEAYISLDINADEIDHMRGHIEDCEKENNANSESIIASERYEFIGRLINQVYIKKRKSDDRVITDLLDRLVTNKYWAIPVFAIIMYIVYSISMGKFGSFLTDFLSDIVFNKFLAGGCTSLFNYLNIDPMITSLVVDGIIGGVGTVLSFLPQMAILFIFIAILEECGYMARVAFIFDRIFRTFGMSGKSFIPIIIGTGCGVPAIMSARTIENEKDRRLTIMLATFIPCAAKMEVVLIITKTFFGNNSFIATIVYFIGIMIIILLGLLMKRIKYFRSNDEAFVMELPDYHLPSIKAVLTRAWENIKGFVVKAGTVIFICCVIYWCLMHFDFSFKAVSVDESMLKLIAEKLSIIFIPLGFGSWQATAASISAFVAKEQATASLGLIAASSMPRLTGDVNIFDAIQAVFNGHVPSALSFMIFNIFSAPCIVAIITMFKEQGSKKWGFITLALQFSVGYILAFITYNLISLFIK